MSPVVVICAVMGALLLSVATHYYEQDRKGRAPSMATTAMLHITGFALFAAACCASATGHLSVPVLALMVFAGAVPFLGYVPAPKRRATTF